MREDIKNCFPCKGIVNPCDGHDCSDMCLLSSTVRRGYTCACPRGGEIMEDGRTCDCKLLGDQNQYFK